MQAPAVTSANRHDTPMKVVGSVGVTVHNCWAINRANSSDAASPIVMPITITASTRLPTSLTTSRAPALVTVNKEDELVLQQAMAGALKAALSNAVQNGAVKKLMEAREKKKKAAGGS